MKNREKNFFNISILIFFSVIFVKNNFLAREEFMEQFLQQTNIAQLPDNFSKDGILILLSILTVIIVAIVLLIIRFMSVFICTFFLKSIKSYLLNFIFYKVLAFKFLVMSIINIISPVTGMRLDTLLINISIFIFIITYLLFFDNYFIKKTTNLEKLILLSYIFILLLVS